MISGPKQSGNDIDAYLSPLIEYLRILWDEGIDVDDANSGEKLKMCAMLFFTINDFPTYGNLTRYSVKGHKVCGSVVHTRVGLYLFNASSLENLASLGAQRNNSMSHDHPLKTSIILLQ